MFWNFVAKHAKAAIILSMAGIAFMPAVSVVESGLPTIVQLCTIAVCAAPFCILFLRMLTSPAYGHPREHCCCD